MDKLLLCALCVITVCTVSAIPAAKHGKHAKRIVWPWDDCRTEGQSCSGAPKCCDTLQCYWEDGYSMLTNGECVACVLQGSRCQRDAQCCSGLQCDKDSIGLDGTCELPRQSGADCHADSMCVSGECDKSGLNLYGHCQ